jgi:multidrug efflux pump subunit AcrA (membrane-fusion protein)
VYDREGTPGGETHPLLARAADVLRGLSVRQWAAVGAGGFAAVVIVAIALARLIGGGPRTIPGASAEEIGGEFVSSAFGPAIRLRRVGFVWSFRRKGRIEPFEDKPISNQESGTIKTVWPDGADVKEGDVVLELDTRGIDREIADDRAEIVVCKAELEQAKQKQAKQIKSAEQERKRTELELGWQRLNERSVLAGALADERARAEARFKTRSLVARNREEEVRILTELAGQGFATATELGQKRLQLTEARLELEKARIARDELVKGPTELERKEAFLEVKIAEYALDSAAKKLDSMKALAASGVSQAESKLRREESDLQEELEDREKHFSRAPADGYVLHTPPFYLSELKAGQRLYWNMKVMSIPSGGKLKVATKVTQAEVDRVEVGTRCRVAVPARPGKACDGEVMSVARQGQDEFADLDGSTREKVGESGRQAFAVEVKLLGEDPDLKIGFRADVEFLLDEVRDALVVPWGAVSRRADGASVTVIADGRPAEREVKLGSSNGRVVVIESGCEEGELVLLARGGG